MKDAPRHIATPTAVSPETARPPAHISLGGGNGHSSEVDALSSSASSTANSEVILEENNSDECFH